MSGGSVFGGKNSVFNNPSQVWGGNNSLFNDPAQLTRWMSASPPPAQTPPAPPDPGQITQATVNGQVQSEAAARASSTLITGGEGIMNQPMTASHILLGN